MQDLVGEDKALGYDLAGDQQSLGGDGPRVGGEMTFAAALASGLDLEGQI